MIPNQLNADSDHAAITSVIQKCCNFFEVSAAFARLSLASDTFGPARPYSDAFGYFWMRLIQFESIQNRSEILNFSLKVVSCRDLVGIKRYSI